MIKNQLKERILEEFLELTAIDSVSYHERQMADGAKLVAKLITDEGFSRVV